MNNLNFPKTSPASKNFKQEVARFTENLKPLEDNQERPNVLITNIKGGVGKSSLARALANDWGSGIVCNDLAYSQGHSDTLNLPTQTKSLPKTLKGVRPIVYDFGAMHASLDSKLAQAFEESDLVILPTILDENSLKATLETAKIFEGQGKPIIIFFNAISKSQEHLADEAAAQLQLVSGIDFYWGILPKTTLMQRMMRDGRHWLKGISNRSGKHQLIKSWIKIQDQLDAVAELARKVKQ